MKGSKELGSRIRQLRGAQTQVQFAAALGINVNTLRGYETGQRMPGADVIAKLVAVADAPLEWLVTGNTPQEAAQTSPLATMPATAQENTILPRPPVWDVPLLGLAACGLKDWFDAGPLPLRVPVPVDYPYNPHLFAVVAFGNSMEPNYIHEGNIVYCDPKRSPEKDDAIYIARKDGKVSIKLFIESNDTTMRIKGWLPPDDEGNAKAYFEDATLSEITLIAPVVVIKRKG